MNSVTSSEDSGTLGEIDRYAIDQLPAEVDPVHTWVVQIRDTVLDQNSEWSEEERAQLEPGLNFLVEAIADELREAIDDLACVREEIDAVPPHLLTHGCAAPQATSDRQPGQVRVRMAVRATARGWFCDLVTAIESTGLPTEQLPELLHDVLLARAADLQPQRTKIVALRQKT